MSQPDLAEEFRCLDLAPPASLLQVEHAYRRKLALYGEHSLATYSLFDEDGRQAQLARLEEAYQRIRGAHAAEIRPLTPSIEGGRESATAYPEVDPAVSPGLYLRARRMQAALTLREIADRTKVSPMKLSQIEEERFDLLPAPVYLRGFVLAYARTLGLPDPEGLSQSFLARHPERKGSGDV